MPLALNMKEEVHGNAQGVQKPGTAHICQTARRQGPPCHSHKELNSANNLNEQENRLSPERRAVLPVPQLSQGDPSLTSDLQNCELINVPYFKP